MNWRLVTASAVTSVGLIALASITAGTGQTGWETAARWTARHSFVWFLGTFAAPAFARGTNGWMLADIFRHRRGLGLSFAALVEAPASRRHLDAVRDPDSSACGAWPCCWA